MNIFEAVKRYRLKARYPDGSAVYSASSAEGSELLTIFSDGSRFIHRIEGIDLERAMGGSGARSSASPLAALGEVTPPQPIQDPVQGTPAPVQEPAPVPEPAPEPVDEQLARDAQMLARSVWFRGGQHRNQLFHGMSRLAADALLSYAVERQWVSVREDVVVPRTVNPVPVMPVRSNRERITAWGPGDGRLW
jgi:hypothetical protein